MCGFLYASAFFSADQACRLARCVASSLTSLVVRISLLHPPSGHDTTVKPLAELPRAAGLSDPRYYLSNVHTVLRWVLQYHTDLLLPAEVARLQAFGELSVEARALLVRLIMRSRVHFVVESLRYEELDAPVSTLVNELVGGQWLYADPRMNADEVAQLLRRDQLRQVMQRCVPATCWTSQARKALWQQALRDATAGERRGWHDWWGDDTLPVIEVPAHVLQLWRRVRLMFFGNLRQDWSEFVLTELGHQRYEPVAFSASSRAFQHRREVDAYLQLADARERLDAGAHWLEVWQSLPDSGRSRWLKGRRARVLEAIAQAAERAGDTAAALAAFDAAGTPAARIRAWRLREQRRPARALQAHLESVMRGGGLTPLECQACERITQRLRRRLQGEVRVRRRDPWPVEHVSLPHQAGSRVEARLAAVLAAEGGHCRHMENTLHTGLLALLCWPAIYAALPGAFFHPFQRGPADLFRESFTTSRRDALEACLATLHDGSWQDVARQIWQSRYGVTNSLMAWPMWDDTLLEGVLRCMKASDVERLLRHLLRDLRAHRSGMPDLFRWWPTEARYEFIEVKGPGDRVQDHQRLWLDFLHRHHMPVRVVHVSWESA